MTTPNNQPQQPKLLGEQEAKVARFIGRIQNRMCAMQEEYVYAASGVALSPGFQPPPSWVIKALQHLQAGPLKPTLQGLGDPSQLLTALTVIAGALDGSVAFMDNPTGAVKETAEASPAFDEFRRHVAEFMGQHAIAIDRAKGQAEAHDASGKPTLARLSTLAAAHSQGLECAQNLTDEITYGSTITARICTLIWIFWPEVQILETVRELKDWLASMMGDQFSEKLVEKICREIGFPPKSGQKACQSLPTNS